MTRAKILAIAKPILFNTEMTKAVLDNRKTVTRRAIKPQPETCCEDGFIYDKIANNLYCKGCGNPFINSKHKECMPKYQIGDYLYVRETFCPMDKYFGESNKSEYCYKANSTKLSEECRKQYGIPWSPSTYMPKEAARIFLRVTDIRVERLHEITIDGIEHEGIPLAYPIVKMIDSKHLKDFICLWNSTIKKQDRDRYGWSTNPWVWVIEFERVSSE